MEVILGKEGLDKTCQEQFPEETKCTQCEGMARIAFVASEDKSPFICELHDNDYKEGGEGYWLHDAASFATYLCKKCFKATTLWNQA